MEECNHKYTLAENLQLGKDESGDLCRKYWKYRSVVGILLYLAESSRQDIAHAAHQCPIF